MYDYRCQDREYLYRRRVQLLPLLPTTSLNHYRRPEDVGFVKYLSETNVYTYFLYDRYENVYFLYIVPNPNRSETHASKV